MLDQEHLESLQHLLGLPLNRRIRWVRKRLGLTQQELAKKLGSTNMQISRWERGAIVPSERYCRRLAEVSGFPLQMFNSRNGPYELEVHTSTGRLIWVRWGPHKDVLAIAKAEARALFGDDARVVERL